MAIRNTTDATEIVVSDPPDWADEVVVDYSFETGIFEAHSAHEQRVRRREAPRLQIEWQRSGLTRAEAEEARTKDYLETFSPCVVPVWTEGAQITAPMGGAAAIIVDTAIRPGLFRAGDQVLMTDTTLGNEARTIATVDVATKAITFGDAGTDTYPAGSVAYPMRRCEKLARSSKIVAKGVNSFTHIRKFITL